MSNENDRSGHTWDDQDESEAPRSFREAYLDAMNPQRPRSDHAPQPETPDRAGGRGRIRNAPGSGRISAEGDERSARPRPTRQSRDEVYARLRQRPRPPIYAREQDEPRPAPTAQQGRARRRPAEAPHRTRGAQPGGVPRARSRTAEYDEYDEYEVYEVSERAGTGRRAGAPPRPRRGRRAFSVVLTGCLGGVITLVVLAAVIGFLLVHNTPLGQNLGVGRSTYTRTDQQALALGNATQLVVKSQAGNILVNTDRSASSASVSSVRRVQASSQSDANTRLRSIELSTRQISQGADPSCIASSCLLLTASVPPENSSGLFGGGNRATIDLTITLPVSFSNPVSPSLLSVRANAGNVVVNGFNGILNLNSIAGNISVAHNSLIFAGTCIQTTHGNVTIAQGSFFDPNQPSSLVPCRGTTSTGAHPWFSVNSGVGNVDIELRADNTNLVLDALSVKGAIHDSFGLAIPTASDGSAAYHGPLVPNANPVASLYIIASTGDITIHKQEQARA